MKKIDEWNQMIKELPKNDRFKIEVDFITPRAGNDILMFDGVLSYFAMRYVLQEEMYNLRHSDWINIDIPVKKWNGSDPFYFITGIMDHPDTPTFWVKRFEKRMLNSVDTNIVRTGTGKYRNYMMPLLTDTKSNYVIEGIGNIEWLEKIIPESWWLGKKTGSGYGECKMVISESNGDPLIKEGRLLRHLPRCYFDIMPRDATLIRCPIRYPYYGKHSESVNAYKEGSII